MAGSRVCMMLTGSRASSRPPRRPVYDPLGGGTCGGSTRRTRVRHRRDPTVSIAQPTPGTSSTRRPGARVFLPPPSFYPLRKSLAACKTLARKLTRTDRVRRRRSCPKVEHVLGQPVLFNPTSARAARCAMPRRHRFADEAALCSGLRCAGRRAPRLYDGKTKAQG